MNPFLFSGPLFLLFYSVAVVIVLILAHRKRVGVEGGDPPAGLMNPYSIAFLRGGKNELIRVATISLIDRGFLEIREQNLKTTKTEFISVVRHAVEKGILQKCMQERETASLFDDPAIAASVSNYDSELQEIGVLPNPDLKSKRNSILFKTVSLFVILAGVKLIKAVLEGRHNIGFLIVLLMISIGLAFKVINPRMTQKGKLFLQDLRKLLQGLKSRAANGYVLRGGVSNELAMLAAVFGIASVPEVAIPGLKKVYAKASSSSSGFSSSCGASCGSSCGSSCGGGCGGGCGGCGG